MPFDAKGWPYFAYFRAVDCKSHVAVFALVDTAAAAGGDQAARAAFEKVVGGCSIGDGSRLAGSPLALGSPPLTQALVDRAASRVEIALEMKLTAPQRALLARALQAYWREQWTGVGAYVSGLNLWDARMAERGRGRAGAIVRARAEILLGCCGRPDGGFEKSILEGRWQKPAEARSGERVLVEARDSMGALTDGDVARYAAFVEWVVGVKLTGAHLEALSRQIRADWRAGGWSTMPLTGALRTWGAASRLGESDRAVIAAYYRANYLRSIAHTFTPTEVIVMKAYDAAYPTLAKGSETLHEPALTADVAGAYAELVCFQANAVAGRDVYAVTPEARAAAGRGLATDYAALSGRMQYSLVLLHETLAETRLTWPMLTDAERAAVRQQWAAWFARPPAPAGGSAEALLEAATVRERADDAAYRKTPQAASWELIRIRAVAETERRGREEANEAMKQWQR
ncbi:MAG TPA: hypothetical protein VK986_24490, partial [Tepidisphaeraceae bacterium]|nr:hypothetical protein [Tepidisphaeraceae bacterium]